MSVATSFAIALIIPADPLYRQLPPEHICQATLDQCEADRVALHHQLRLLSGWNTEAVLERHNEAVRLCAIWYAAHWVTWSKVSPEQRDEWAGTLVAYIGREAFWRGELPPPLSWR